jgi:tetratricopeptide (TPR) repeat protein
MASLQSLVSLNNAGVALLSKGAYKESIELFRKAVAVFNNEACRESVTTEAQALATLAKQVTCVSSVITVKALEFDVAQVSSFLSVMKYGPSLSVIHPIRLPTNNTAACDEFTVEAVLAYNHGLSYYCMSHYKRSRRSIEASRSALSHANRHLQRAHTLSLTLGMDGTKHSGFAHTLLVLGCEGVILNTLIQTLAEEGYQEEAEKVYESAVKIRDIIEQNLEKYPTLHKVTAATA